MVAKAQSPKQPLSKVRIAIAIALLQTVILFFFDAQGYLERVVEIERTMNAALMGETAEREFKERADNIFFGWVVDSGLYMRARRWTEDFGSSFAFSDTRSRQAGQSEMWKRVEVFWLAFWLMVYRLLSAFHWVLAFAPFLGALLFDALMGREARKWRFEMTSPLKHELYSHGFVMAFALLVYAPFALIPTPSWVLTALLGAVIFLGGGIMRSAQKRV